MGLTYNLQHLCPIAPLLIMCRRQQMAQELGPCHSQATKQSAGLLVSAQPRSVLFSHLRCEPVDPLFLSVCFKLSLKYYRGWHHGID